MIKCVPHFGGGTPYFWRGHSLFSDGERLMFGGSTPYFRRGALLIFGGGTPYFWKGHSLFLERALPIFGKGTWQTAIKQKQKKVNGSCQASTPQALTHKHSVRSLPQTYWESTKSDSIACQTATKPAKDTWRKKTMSLGGGTPYFLKGHSLFLEEAVLIFETTVLSLQKQWALTEPLTIQPTPTP